jgi:Flp pilus assembly protein TadG
VEFCGVAILTVLMLLFIVEMGRMVLVFTAVANAARAGVRYAIVHGSSRGSSGAAIDNASGPASNPTQVVNMVKNFASSGLLNTSLLVVNVTYPGASNAPGQTVNVTVVYPYDPLTAYFTNSLRLGSASQGVIVY